MVRWLSAMPGVKWAVVVYHLFSQLYSAALNATLLHMVLIPIANYIGLFPSVIYLFG